VWPVELAYYTVANNRMFFSKFSSDHDSYWRSNILENGFNTDYAVRSLDEMDNLTPSVDEMELTFTSPMDGDFSLVDGVSLVDQTATDADVAHDFCGYPRGATADLGAIEYSTAYEGTPCSTMVKEMYDRIP